MTANPCDGRGDGVPFASSPGLSGTLDARIGLRLSLARRLARLPVGSLADRLSWPACLIEAYESGAQRIPASDLQAVADALCLPVAWFYGPVQAGTPDAERRARARHAVALDGLTDAMESRSEAERAVLVAHTIRLANQFDRTRTAFAAGLAGAAGQQISRQQGPMEQQLAPLPSVAPNRAPSSMAPSGTAPSRRRVMVVDDAADVLVTTGAFVEAAGHEVVRAPDADVALRLLAAGERIDAIVTDYAMPTLSGVDLLLLAVQMRPGIPALIITGFADVAGLAELPAGIEVLHKPFRRAQFVAHLNALLDRDAAPPVAAAHPAGAVPG